MLDIYIRKQHVWLCGDDGDRHLQPQYVVSKETKTYQTRIELVTWTSPTSFKWLLHLTSLERRLTFEETIQKQIRGNHQELGKIDKKLNKAYLGGNLLLIYEKCFCVLGGTNFFYHRQWLFNVCVEEFEWYITVVNKNNILVYKRRWKAVSKLVLDKLHT